MSKLLPFRSERIIKVYDVKGEFTRRTVPVQNPAIDYYFPQEKVAGLWLTFEDNVPEEGDVTREYNITESNITTGKSVTTRFYGKWAWGSSVKTGRTTLLTHDILRDTGMGAKNEDGFRFNRWLLPNAMYGAATGKLKIKFLPKGASVGSHIIGDGFGLVTQSVADIARDKKYKPSKPGQTKDTFHMWQMLHWDAKLEEECLPHIHKLAEQYNDISKWDIGGSTSIDEKRELCALEPAMEFHPSVAQALMRSSQRRALSFATSVPTETYSRIAIPTSFPLPVIRGRAGIVTYPIQVFGNVRAFTLHPEKLPSGMREHFEQEEARIANMMVCQHSTSTSRFAAKGLTGIVPDSDLVINGVQYDMVLCNEDVKMCTGMTVDKFRESVSEIEDDDTYFGMTMLYARGVAVGIPYNVWVVMGRDYDGDYAFVADLNERPVLYSRIASLPHQNTGKLKKSNGTWKSAGDIRPKMILDSIEEAVLVGVATNMRCTVFSVDDVEELAKDRGWRDAMTLLNVADELIRIGTDGFKSLVDIPESVKKCNRIMSSLVSRLGTQAPWCKWKNDPYMFKHALPRFARSGMSKVEAEGTIPVGMDGTIAQILKITLPILEHIISTPIEARPLTSFMGWAPRVSQDVENEAYATHAAYSQEVSTVNWTDPASVDAFHAWWRNRCEEFVLKIGDRQTAVNAMWRVAHSNRTEKAGGMAVFIGFPDDIQAIIKNKPGLKVADQERYVLTGINYVLDDKTSKDFTCEVQVTLNEFVNIKDGIKTLRKVAIANLPGQRKANPGYPDGCLGTFSKDSRTPEPEVGAYVAHVRRNGETRMWVTELTPKA